ncbi:MAG: ATP-binding cassette domain-containing protein [Clostridiales bacterium]|nr:ATP-binding cassette domain-containing protein [Clostridiales bacterium]
MGDGPAMLEVRGLRQHFPVRKDGKKRFLKAVDGVDLEVRAGETFGLVGESGCGKSTLARSVIRIYEPTGGQVLVDGEDITHKPQKQLRPLRKKMQMIFQDPYSSLNSRMSVRDILMEPLIASHVGESAAQREEMAMRALARVGLMADAAGRYPHEFSGGQRQRVGIARALITRPKLVICDEAISALDVSIQAQVVNLLGEFQRELGLAYLFIAHDLSMVRYVSHRVGVMYLGRMAEVCGSEEIYANPLHPYTQALLESIPIPDPAVAAGARAARLEGEVPSPIDPPAGCHFHPRCPKAMSVCRQEEPAMREMGGDHCVRCHLYG